MIYTNNTEYQIYYYQTSDTKHTPVLEYIQNLSFKEKVKTVNYINLLQRFKGYIGEPYSRYICSGIRELRINFSHNNHRIFYIIVEERKIILLHAFLKKTRKTPPKEIKRALNNFNDYQLYKSYIEYEET